MSQNMLEGSDHSKDETEVRQRWDAEAADRPNRGSSSPFQHDRSAPASESAEVSTFARWTTTAALIALLLTACGDATTDSTTGQGADQQEQQSAEADNPNEATDNAGEEEADTDEPEESEVGDSDAAEGEDDLDVPPAASRVMSEVETITGEITPKSVVASGDGLVIANNMMYSHTVTFYDAEERELVQTLDDSLDFSEYGVDGYDGEVSGAPVEAVWTEDGQYVYVSQYQLTGHGATADDNCTGGQSIAESVVYRYSVAEEDWDQVIQVGRVPKFVALGPGDESLLVSNWCDQSLSVVDTETGQETEQIPLNSMPRGIEVLPDGDTAYVTAMYANEVYKVDLETGESELAFTTGERPRHLVLSEDGEHLYLTVAGANQLLKVEAESGEIVDEVTTGLEPRSMDISADGTALYVVNYDENTVSKYDAETLEELQREPTGGLPVGVTYDTATNTVWVANYAGSLTVFDDTEADNESNSDQ